MMSRPSLLALYLAAGSALGACDTILDFEIVHDTAGDAGPLKPVDAAPSRDADGAARADAACGPLDAADNCGVCAHSCLGGACSAGVCQPVILASGQGNAAGAEVSDNAGAGLDGPDRIASDGTNVYWLDLSGAVMSVPVAGGTPFHVAATNGLPVWIELDATYVYFMSRSTGTIFRVQKSGGTPVELTPAPPPGGVGDEFTIFGGDLYWADTVADYMCPISGCGTAKNLWTAANDELEATDGYMEFPYSMTVFSASNIFVSAIDTTNDAFIDLPTAGMACVEVPTDDHYVELHSDTTNIYALSYSAILEASGSECGPATYLASGMEGPPHGLALDDGFVYWVDVDESIGTVSDSGISNAFGGGPNTIRRCAKTGCASPEMLASEPSTANGLAVDTLAVYWTTGDGKVKRLAKPSP